MYGSGNSDKQSCIITCLIFSSCWVLVGVSLVLVGFLAPPLYTPGTDPYNTSRDDIYNCKIAGLIIIPLSCVWCSAMCFWFCKDSADFKRLQSERIAAVNREEFPSAAVNNNNSAPNQQQIVITPVPVAANVGHFCRKCGTPRQGIDVTFCVKCGASLSEGVPTGISSQSYIGGNGNNNDVTSITYPSNPSYIPPAPRDNNIVVNVQLVPPSGGGGRHTPRSSGNGLPAQPPSFNDVMMRPNNPYGLPGDERPPSYSTSS